MATRTTLALADAALKLMNQKRVGDEMDDEDVAAIREAWAALNAELRDRSMSYWGDDEIPLEVFRHVTRLVAIEVAPGYGTLPIVLQSISQPTSEGAREAVFSALREHIATRPVYDTLRIEVF